MKRERYKILVYCLTVAVTVDIVSDVNKARSGKVKATAPKAKAAILKAKAMATAIKAKTAKLVSYKALNYLAGTLILHVLQ